jgi:hypothetical protein
MVYARTNTNTNDNPPAPPERIAIVRWAAGLGAVTAEALAEHLGFSVASAEVLAEHLGFSVASAEALAEHLGFSVASAEVLTERPGFSVASARARLGAAERRGLLERHSPLRGRAALYTVTRAGLRAAGVRGLDPCRVSASNALHLIECARAAAALERCYPDHRVQGERELRGEERESRRVLASAELGAGTRGEASRHRPDLVLWPADTDGGLPVAVEVELTVKAPERLSAICRAWARARCVAGVLYLAAPDVERHVRRAIERAHADERVVVVPLDALPARPAERTVPSGA